MALLLAIVAADLTAVLAADPDALSGCDAAFVLAEHAQAALDAGVDEVLALSGHPLGLPCAGLPPMVGDYARDVPSYGDHYGRPRPGSARIELAGHHLGPGPTLSSTDRLLTTLAPTDAAGAAALLGALRAGAGLVLLRAGDAATVARTEQVTVTAGIELPGLTRVV